VSSHFAAIGFPVREMAEYRTLLREAAAKGQHLPLAGGGALARWEVGGGPEVWALIDPSGHPLEATPFHTAGRAHRLALTAYGEDPEEEQAGWVEGWLEPREPDEPLSGLFPLRMDLVDFPLARPALRTGAVLTVEFAGLVHEARLFPDAAAYEAVRQLTYQPPVRAVISVGSHTADAEPGVEPEATALITGVVTRARLLTNAASGAPYWRLDVDSEVEVTVLADRETLPGAPRAGNVLAASCWVVGRTVPQAGATPADRGLAQDGRSEQVPGQTAQENQQQ
jgi:hypothetical protein